MSKKPASLTSDLLARKGEAEPSPIDPGARMSLFAEGADYAAAGGNGESEERPRPPEPEIIYTAEETSTGGGGTRLVILGVLAAIVIGGIFLVMSGRNEQSVAPVSPDIARDAGKEAPATQPAEDLTPQPPSPATEAAPAGTAPEETASSEAAPAESTAGNTAPATAAPQAAGEAPTAQPAEPAPALRSSNEPAAAQPAETPAPAAAEPVEAPAPARPAAAPAKAVSAGAYVVQISALRDEKSARAAWHSMLIRYPAILGGHALDIEKADLGAKGTWYRVRAAGFATKAAAAESCAALKAKGQGCMVKKR